MGAGVSNTLRSYVLKGWDPEVNAPRDAENEARVLARYAFILAEVFPPLHLGEERVGEPPSEPSAASGKRHRRPRWLEPSLLHVLLVSRDPDLAEVPLDGLRGVSPLAKVTPDPHDRDGGAYAAACKAGFHSYAFIDAELRTLRLWRASEGDLEADAAVDDEVHGSARLPFFDLVLWLVDETEDPAALPVAAPTAAKVRESPQAAKARLAQELKAAKAAKQAAIQAEDFEQAQALKAREADLCARLQAAEAAAESAVADELQLSKALEEARAAKRKAVEAEDFKEAQRWKTKEKDLEAQLAALKLSAEAVVDVAAVAAAPSGGSWRQRLGALVGEGLPPVLVVGIPCAPSGLRTEAVHAGLPPDRIWALPQLPPSRRRPGLCGEPSFWALAHAVLGMVNANRGFPENLPRLNLPSDLKLGASVRLRHLDVPQAGAKAAGKPGGKEALAVQPKLHAHLNGQCGTVVGYEGEGPIPPSLFLVRLWDGEVLRVVREQMTLLNFKLGASSPVQLTCMDRMRVRLKDLKSKPELNDREGEADDKLVDGRYTVTFKEGGHVAVKPDNVVVLEPATPELQGSVGLVDARDGARSRYKVLLVQTNERTLERSQVRLQGLQAKPELNGKEAVIDVYNPKTERFTVRLADGSGEVAVRRQNFEFTQQVRIEAVSLDLQGDRVDYFLDPEDMEMLCQK